MVQIRAAQPEDAQVLSALAMAAKAHWGYDANVLEGWRKDLTISSADILRYPVYVAHSGPRIAGFYMLIPGSPDWTLEHMWVSPPSMRQGVGSLLISHALNVAAQGGAHRVMVTADPNAAGFYEHAGGRRGGKVFAPIPGAPARTLPRYEFTKTRLLP